MFTLIGQLIIPIPFINPVFIICLFLLGSNSMLYCTPLIFKIIYFWLCWAVLLCKTSCSEWGLLSNCSSRASYGGGFLHGRELALEHVGFSRCSSQALEHRFNSCGTGASLLTACGLFPHQGSNPCLLHWHADSLPLSHQGNSTDVLIKEVSKYVLICTLVQRKSFPNVTLLFQNFPQRFLFILLSEIQNNFDKSLKKKIFIWLCRVLVAAHGIFAAPLGIFS